MGAAVARALIKAGYQVTVWNRTESKAMALAAAGASATDDLADAVAASPISLWCLLDYPMISDHLIQVSKRAALDGHTVIPIATAAPEEVTILADALESIGAVLLDAKIMFFPAQVGDDDAEILLSGSESAFNAFRGLLRDLAGGYRYVGSDVTAASVLYTAVWSYDFASRFAYMEAAALVDVAGFSLKDFQRSAALRTAQLGAQNEELSARFRRADFGGDQATVDVYAEGVGPMLNAFGGYRVTARMLEAVGAYARAAKDAGYGANDISVIFDVIRERVE